MVAPLKRTNLMALEGGQFRKSKSGVSGARAPPAGGPVLIAGTSARPVHLDSTVYPGEH